MQVDLTKQQVARIIYLANKTKEINTELKATDTLYYEVNRLKMENDKLSYELNEIKAKYDFYKTKANTLEKEIKEMRIALSFVVRG